MRSVMQSLPALVSADHSGLKEHPYNLRHALERFERDYLHNILVLAAWDQFSAAYMLGIQLKTLESKLKKYELTPPGSIPGLETQGGRR